MQFATTIVCALFAQAAAAYSFPADEQKPSAAVVVGEVRVSALSPSLIRIEPKGPAGFEDRESTAVVTRFPTAEIRTPGHARYSRFTVLKR